MHCTAQLRLHAACWHRAWKRSHTWKPSHIGRLALQFLPLAQHAIQQAAAQQVRCQPRCAACAEPNPVKPHPGLQYSLQQTMDGTEGLFVCRRSRLPNLAAITSSATHPAFQHAHRSRWHAAHQLCKHAQLLGIGSWHRTPSHPGQAVRDLSIARTAANRHLAKHHQVVVLRKGLPGLPLRSAHGFCSHPAVKGEGTCAWEASKKMPAQF